MMRLTLSRCISLHEPYPRASILEFRTESSQLWKLLVDNPKLRSKFVFVDMAGKKPPNVAWGISLLALSALTIAITQSVQFD